MWARGSPPPVTDEMEIWQVARALDFDRERAERISQTPNAKTGSGVPLPPPRYSEPDRDSWGNNPAEWAVIDAMASNPQRRAPNKPN